MGEEASPDDGGVGLSNNDTGYTFPTSTKKKRQQQHGISSKHGVNTNGTGDIHDAATTNFDDLEHYDGEDPAAGEWQDKDEYEREQEDIEEDIKPRTHVVTEAKKPGESVMPKVQDDQDDLLEDVDMEDAATTATKYDKEMRKKLKKERRKENKSRNNKKENESRNNKENESRSDKDNKDRKDVPDQERKRKKSHKSKTRIDDDSTKG